MRQTSRSLTGLSAPGCAIAEGAGLPAVFFPTKNPNQKKAQKSAATATTAASVGLSHWDDSISEAMMNDFPAASRYAPIGGWLHLRLVRNSVVEGGYSGYESKGVIRGGATLVSGDKFSPELMAETVTPEQARLERRASLPRPPGHPGAQHRATTR